MDQLIRTHVDAARRVARRVARQVRDADLRADVESAALLGLTEAAQRYDASRGEPFFAFAVKRVRGAAFDELRRSDTLPRRERQRAKQLSSAAAAVEARTGCAANDNQIADEMGVALEDIEATRARIHAHSRVPYDGLLENTLACVAPSALDQIEHSQKMKAVGEAMPRLTPRDRQIIDLSYRRAMNLRQIGDRLGVSESRVCQLRSRAIAALRREVAQKLRSASNDNDDARGSHVATGRQ